MAPGSTVQIPVWYSGKHQTLLCNLKITMENFQGVVSAPMLTPAIHQSFQNGIEKLAKTGWCSRTGKRKDRRERLQGTAGKLLKTDVEIFGMIIFFRRVFAFHTGHNGTNKEELMNAARSLHDI